MRKNLGNGVVKKAIIWAMSFMMTFTPVFGSIGSITALAAEDENSGNSDGNSGKSTDSNNKEDEGTESGSENKNGESDKANSGSDSADQGNLSKKEQNEAIGKAQKEGKEAEQAETKAAVSAILTVGNGVIANEAGAISEQKKAGEKLQEAENIIAEGNKNVGEIIDQQHNNSVEGLITDIGNENDKDSDTVYSDINAAKDVIEQEKEQLDKVGSNTEAANTAAEKANNGATAEYDNQEAYDKARAEYDKNVEDYEGAKQAAEGAKQAATDISKNVDEKLKAAEDSYKAAEEEYTRVQKEYNDAVAAAAKAKEEAEQALAAGIEDAQKAVERAEQAQAKVAELKDKVDKAHEVTQGWVDGLGGENGTISQAKNNLHEATKDFIEAMGNVGDELTSQDQEGLKKTEKALLDANAALVSATGNEFNAMLTFADKAAAVAEIEIKKVAAEKSLELAKEAVGKMENVDAATAEALEAAKQAVEATEQAYNEACADLEKARKEEAAKKEAEDNAQKSKNEAEEYENSEKGQNLSALEKSYAEAKRTVANLTEDATEEEKENAAKAKEEAEQALVSAAIKEQLFDDATVEVQNRKDNENGRTVYKVTTVSTEGEEKTIYYQSVENEDGTISLYDYRFDGSTNYNYIKENQTEEEKSKLLDGLKKETRDGQALVEGVDYVIECTREPEEAEYTVTYDKVEKDKLTAVRGGHYEKVVKSIYDNKDSNVSYKIQLNEKEYELKAYKIGPIYTLKYIDEKGEEKGIDFLDNIGGFWCNKYTKSEANNVKASSLEEYEKYANIVLTQTKFEVTAQYKVTYYDVAGTAQKVATDFDDEFPMLTKEQKEILYAGGVISTPEMQIKKIKTVQHIPSFITM